MNQFTESVTEALQAAFAEAQRRNQTEVTENHLLWAFMQDPQGYFNSILSNLGTKPQTLLREMEHNLEHLPTFSGSGGAQPPAPSRSLQSRIADAENIAEAGKTPIQAATIFWSPTGKMGANPLPPGRKQPSSPLTKSKNKSKK